MGRVNMDFVKMVCKYSMIFGAAFLEVYMSCKILHMNQMGGGVMLADTGDL